MSKKIFIISIILFAVVLVIIFIIKKIKRKRLVSKILSEGEGDYAITAKNIAQSISQSKVLYKELITKVHPDRFPNDPIKQERASKISAMLTEAKRNYNKLLEISILIENELK